MEKENTPEWATAFVNASHVSGKRVPLERVIEAHRETLNGLRSQGLTWTAIAEVLNEAGARRRDGRPISADQLRAEVSRLNRRAEITPSSPRTSDAVREPAAPQPRLTPPRESARTTRKNSPQIGDHLSKTLSQDDLLKALHQIGRK